ncbi:MAG TPA: cyclic nucleotide-binding domain-containing protein [Acidimicrobiales bacterium]|jgi:signal-transduction protein with cAMP-binding, CBS, and nucleotidyltransferase domain
MRLTTPTPHRDPEVGVASRDLIKRLELFHDLPDAELDHLRAAFELETVRPGRILQMQDVPMRHWRILVAGHAVVERDATPIGLLGAGDSWSEHSLLNNLRSSIGVVALSPAVVLTLSRAQFFALPEDHPLLAGRLVARSATSADRLALPVHNALVHMEAHERA